MVKQVECFKTEESVRCPGKYKIVPVHENFHLEKTEGSFNLICARLMGLSYAQYLRFCRDICGAEIYGKNIKYPIAYFKTGSLLNQLVKTLNLRANMILWERANPDWEKHQKLLQSKQKEMAEIRGGIDVFN